MHRIFGTVKDTWSAWQRERAPYWAAAVAFYTMLSVGPMLLLTVMLVGAVFGRDAAAAAVLQQLATMMGEQAAEGLASVLYDARGQGLGGGLVASTLGLAALLFGATGVFAALQEAMDDLWHVRPRPDGGIKLWLKQRFLSASMVLSLGFLLMASLAFDGVVGAAWARLDQYGVHGGRGAAFVASWSLLTVMVAATFRVLPDAHLPWRTALSGGAMTALLLNIGKTLIGRYLGASGVTQPFGPAGSLAVVLLWVYYAAQLLFIGALFTRVLAERDGHGIVPDADGVAARAA